MQRVDVVAFAASADRVRYWGAVLSLDASDATYARWIDDRARHIPWGSRARRGFADGTMDALDVCRSVTLVCQQEGCGALVHWMTARRAAKAAGRDAFAIGDGCSGRGCSRHYRPSRFKARQRKMAMAMRERPTEGGRVCCEWPCGRSARELRVMPMHAACTAADTALAAIEA